MATGGDPESELASIMSETNTGKVACSIKEASLVIKEYYDQLFTEGALPYCGDKVLVEQYSYLSATKNLKECLDTVSIE